MSWLDTIGDAFKNWAGSVAGGARPSIGGAFAGLSGTPEAAAAAQSMAAQSTQDGNRNLFSPNTYTEPIQKAQEAGQYLAYHGTSAAVQMAALGLGDPSAPKGSIVDINTWKAAFNRNLTPVQSAEIALGLKPGNVGFGDSDADVAARKHYFHDTLMGRIATGPLDMVFGFVADPTVVGAKVSRTAALARVTFKGAEEAADVLKLNELRHSFDAADQAALKTAPKRQQRLESYVEDEFFASLDNKTLPEINAHPLMPQSGGGVYAVMFDEINHKFPGTSPMEVAARREAQRTVFGAMIGNQDAIAALRAKRDVLQGQYDDLLNGPPPPSSKLAPPSPFPESAGLTDTPHNALPEGPSTKVNPAQAYADLTRRLENLSVPPASTRFEVAHAAGTDLETNLRDFQDEFDPEILEKMADIGYEIKRLTSAIGNARQVDRARATFAERRDYQWQLSQLNTTYLDKGIGHTPVRIVSGLLSNQLPHHIATDDAELGAQQFQATLNRADFLPVETKQSLMSDFLSAQNQAQRWVVVKRAQALTIRSVLEEYKLKPQHIEQLLAATRDTETTWTNILTTRAYSAHAMNQDVATLFDPEMDEIYAVARPILKSQLEDNVMFVDPRLIQKAASQLTSNKFATVIRNGQEVLSEDVLRKWNNLWKQGTLLRPSYAFRIQMDTQLRLVSYMGMLSYLANMRYSVPAGFRWLASDADGNIALKNVLHPTKGNYAAAFAPSLKDRFGFSDEQVGWASRNIEGHAMGFGDFATNLADMYTANMRATGKWQIYPKDDPLWSLHFDRAINHQIMNDPLAKHYLMNGGSEADLVRALNGKLRDAWLEMRAIWPNPKNYAHEAKSMVDYYLADPEVRAHVVQNEGISQSAIGKFFDGAANQGKKMDIHGESYLTMKKQNRVMGGIRAFRDNSFKLLSDAPETILGRHPMFMYAFNRRMATIQKMAGKSLTLDELNDARWAAMKGAKADLRRVLYDASDTTNLSRSLGIFSPFVAAWEDTMKKYGYILYNHPEASPRMDMLYDWPENLGLTTDEYGNRIDENGNRYDIYGNLVPEGSPTYGKQQWVTLPLKVLSGGLLKDWSFRREQLNTAFPSADTYWFPGFGPMVQIPANWFIKQFAPTFTDSGVGKLILPFGTTQDSPLWQLAPSYVRNLAIAFDDSSQDNLNQFNLYMQEERTKYLRGERKTMPTTDEISGMVKQHFLLRFVSAFSAPVNITPKGDLDFYHTVAQNFRQLYGSKWPDSIPEDKRTREQYWEYKFREQFPDYYLMTVGLSVSNDGIAATPAGISAEQKYRADIAAHPEYGALFAGVDSQYGDDADHKFSQGAYTWQQQQVGNGQTLQFRGEKSPVDAIAQSNIAEGWRKYQSFMTALDTIMKQNGITSLRKSPVLTQLRDAFVAQNSKNNDDWAAAYGQHNDAKAVEMLKAAQGFMDRHPGEKDRADMQAIQQYIVLRQAFRGMLAQAGVKSINAQTVQDTIAPAWDAAMTQLKESSIGFEQEFNRWLANDDLSQELSN